MPSVRDVIRAREPPPPRLGQKDGSASNNASSSSYILLLLLLPFSLSSAHKYFVVSLSGYVCAGEEEENACADDEVFHRDRLPK